MGKSECPSQSTESAGVPGGWGDALRGRWQRQKGTTIRTVKSFDKLLKFSGLIKTGKPLASFRLQAAFRVVFGTRKI